MSTLRFIEKYDPADDVTTWYTERFKHDVWHYVGGSISCDKEEALEFFKRAQERGVDPVVKVLEEV